MERLTCVPALLLRAGAIAAAALLGACTIGTASPPGTSAAGFATALARALPYTVGVYGLAVRGPEEVAGAQAPDERGIPTQPHARIGAGFVIDTEGHLVTAAHVVADCETVVIKLADQRVLAAELIGTDADTDIALLRIPVRPNLPPPLGRSTTLRPGHWVLSVGEPYGLNRSVAAGIVGGMDRHFSEAPELLYLQTDLALNPGNSGGPLLDIAGDIVGMNMRSVVGAYGAPGLSLSIPIEIVQGVAAELRAAGSIVRPRLGAEFDDVTAPLALARGRGTTHGAVVATVRAGSLAERMGLRVDDIVVAMNQRAILQSADLARALLAWRQVPGTRLVVVRGDQLRTLQLD